jgi:putative peptidoglycan lipid II flippase
MNSNKGLFKPTVLITAFSLLGVAVNFLLQLLIAYFFGASFERDAYFVAITVPTYLAAIFTGSIGIIFLPKFVDFIRNRDPETLNNFLSTTLSIVGLVVMVLIVLFLAFS